MPAHTHRCHAIAYTISGEWAYEGLTLAEGAVAYEPIESTHTPTSGTGAELVRHYKPDREVYQSAADILDLPPSAVMMVAAHLGDLRAAKGVGLKTAFVTRPMEFGPSGKPDLAADSSVDVSAKDFNDLATHLGA